jgi:DNA-cytosine methyltransferase
MRLTHRQVDALLRLRRGARVDSIDIIVGGPPCQGLSTANSKACLEDPRNGLIWEYLRMVAEIRPKAFIIENVPAILTVARGALFNAICQLANEAGYDVTAQKIDACSYGVPQHRVRTIIVGTDSDLPGYRFPMPTHWALGRPIDGDGWQEGGDKPEPGKIRRALPPQAHYDPATRTWSFHNDDENCSRIVSKTVDREQQLDWTADK